MAVLPALICSQIAIVQNWQDAKYGTIANLMILLSAIASWGSGHFQDAFREDVKQELKRQENLKPALVTESDLSPLPLPVQKYLRFTGAVGKARVYNMRVEFEGEMRQKGKEFFPFHSVQYNFFDEYSRLFFMTAKMKGLQVPGYHRYLHQQASMDIRLFGLFSVTRQQGPVMDKTETVTLFNDICLMAPAALLDPRIQWQLRDSLSAKAIFSNGSQQVSAILYFDAEGALVNFVSDDRTEINANLHIPFSTPIQRWQKIDGRTLIKEGDGVWHYPDGAFVYGKFRLKKIEYNVSGF
jgi:hypothetical protein